MSLTDKNRDLILTLQKNPLASYVDISQSMNITPATAKKRLASLWSKETHDPIVMNIAGNLNHKNLDLKVNTFLVEVEGYSNPKQLKQFYDLFEFHPYTAYQNRMYGSMNGFLVQFRSPIGSENLLEELLTKIREDIGITRIEQFSQTDFKFDTYPNVNAWKNGRWEFNFQDWFEDSRDFKETHHENQINHPQFDISQFELNHLIVARELTINARRKQSEIMADIQDSDQYTDFEKKPFSESNQREVSRYFDFVNNNQIIRNYQLAFNRERFGLFNQICFFGQMKNEKQDQLISALKSTENKIPFRVSINFNENYYFMSMDLPPPQSLQAMNFVFDLSTEMHMIVLESSLTYQRNYPIWHRNYIDNASGWKWNDSREWIVDTPISEIMN